MTEHKHLKQLVRGRMAKTGESYSTARRQVLRQAPATPSKASSHHYPGSVAAAAALRALLAQAGVRNPETNAPFSEAMVFGIAGGIGAGMFAFHYAKANFSSFYLAGRHLWQDHLVWAQAATRRLGVKAVVKETSGPATGEKQLRELLDGGRPVLAWVDGYRIIAIHGIDDATGTALIGDTANQLIPIPLAELAATRAAIKSYKHRVLALEPAKKTPALEELVRGGIAACVGGLRKGKLKNFTLEAFATWADRLDGSKAPDAWEKIFPPGPLLYAGLRSICDTIEHTGTGGGLSRPAFADFLAEAGQTLGDRALLALAERYAALGARWSELADAALPDSVPELRKTKALLAEKAELFHSDAGVGQPEALACGTALSAVEAQLGKQFPLDAGQSAALRKELQVRVRSLHTAELEAVSALESWL